MTLTEAEPQLNGEATSDIPTPYAEAEDSFEILPSGKARFVADAKTYVLRRPRFGEYRTLRESVIAIGDRPVAEQLDAMVEWVKQVFGMLSDRALPAEVEEWPSWLAAGGFNAQLLIAWRDVPLAPGGQAG